MKRSIRFRVYHLIHNCVAHPLLPLADVLMGTRLESVALEIQKFHDNTIPEGDVYNVQRFGDEMLERMQTPEARMRMDRAFHASPAELSRAAVEAAKKAKR